MKRQSISSSKIAYLVRLEIVYKYDSNNSKTSRALQNKKKGKEKKINEQQQ